MSGLHKLNYIYAAHNSLDPLHGMYGTFSMLIADILYFLWTWLERLKLKVEGGKFK